MSAALPTGTVTFLFTDVEGSTRLLDELGAEGYGVELGRHREIVRLALSAHDGAEVDTQGDAFFCAFGSARAAVACAAQIQRDLAATPIRVRIGVHTGEALVVDRHYVGIDVHRAARVGACGHGGQIVLSPTTVALLEPDEVDLRNLGAHRLKDLAAAVVLHQVGATEFPPLKTLYRTNLPVPATPFLGRGAELAELVALATEVGTRVLTLTGPGGTGKTRLALQLAAEVADRYPDGIRWAPLAPLRDGALVSSAVATAIGVDEEPGSTLVESVASSLERKRVLLLVDNCEHVIEAAAHLVAFVSSRAPGLLVVATSREPLAVAGEHVFLVQPLVDDDASALFYARARSVGADLEGSATADIVRRLCSRLDNLPLAVELAAARAAVLPPAALLERLASGLDLLKGPRDVEERQRTLRATIAWSYGLLDDSEQQLFGRLAVFVGGASLSAIERVCDASVDDLLSLVSKSLVRHASTDGEEPRYFMLETIREFAVDQLEVSGELSSLRDRHVDWFLDVGPKELAALESIGSGESLARLESDLANLRAAFAWAAEHAGRAADAVALAQVLFQCHFMRGRYREAESVLRRTLELEAEPLSVALLYDLLAVVLRLLGRPRESLDAYAQAEQILDELAVRDEAWRERWISLKLNQAHFFYFQNDESAHEAVLDELEPMVATHGTAAQQLDLLHARARHRYRKERYVLSQETEELARRLYALDVESWSLASDFSLGFCLLWRGKPAEADQYFERGREVAREGGLALIEARCLVYGLVARRKLDDVAGARMRVEELAALEELHGYEALIDACAAWVAYRDGDLELASSLGEQALAKRSSEDRVGYAVFEWTARFPLLGTALARGDLDAAAEHARAMRGPAQQPLPDDIAGALDRAIETRKPRDFAAVIEVARPGGYA